MCVSENPLLLVAADGTVSGVLRVCNNGTQAAPTALELSAFSALARDGQAYALGTTSKPGIEGAAADADGRTPIAPNACVNVKVEASKLQHAGPLTATLRNGKEKLVDLKAVRAEVPFNLKIDGATPDKLDIVFVEGQDSAIQLRNEDALRYRFLWRLEIDGKVHGSGAAEVLPERSVDLKVRPLERSISFWDSGFLGSATRPGRLVLQHEPDPSFAELPYAQKRQQYPVSARLNYFGPTTQKVVNWASILALLLIGIVASLLINYTLPMQRKRVAIKQRLADQDGRLAGLGEVVPSRTLSLLRIEKRRLGQALRGLWPWYPTTETELPKLEQRIDSLARRIDLTVTAGEHLTALKDDATLAPHETDAVADCCRTALEVADKPTPGDDDIGQAQAALDRAAQLRSKAGDKPGTELLDALRARAAKVPAQVITDGAAAEPWKPLQDLLGGLRQHFLGATETDPSRQRYVQAAQALCDVAQSRWVAVQAGVGSRVTPRAGCFG